MVRFLFPSVQVCATVVSDEVESIRHLCDGFEGNGDTGRSWETSLCFTILAVYCWKRRRRHTGKSFTPSLVTIAIREKGLGDGLPILSRAFFLQSIALHDGGWGGEGAILQSTYQRFLGRYCAIPHPIMRRVEKDGMSRLGNNQASDWIRQPEKLVGYGT
jgi:hypothetical protein